MKQDTYIFKLYSQNDFSDNEYLKIRNLDLSANSFSNLLIKQKFKSEFSKKIISIFLTFEEGLFIPEKVDVYEPISEKFDFEKIDEIIDWISQAGGGLMFKKNRKIKYSAIFENNRLSKIWSDGKCNLTFNDPKFLSQITLLFPKLEPQNLDLVKALCFKLNETSKPCISYLYKGVNIDFGNLENFNKNDLILDLKKYNSELISIF